MNWFKKAYGDPLELRWDKIALELQKELGRPPLTSETQSRLLQKYWGAVDAIEQAKTKDEHI